MVKMKLDVYSCEECTRAFAVEEAEDPKTCPCCEGKLYEYSHTVEAELINESQQ